MTGREHLTPLVLVAEECAGAGWEVVSCDGGGRVSPPHSYEPGPWRQRLNQWLSAVEPAPVQAVVLLLAGSESVEYPVTETLLPCPVLSLPRQLALAAFAPAEWPRFAVVDAEESGRCALVTRSEASRFYYAESAAAESCAAARTFGYEPAVTGGDVAGFRTVERVPGANRFQIGAARLAVAALAADGVCRNDGPAGPILRLARRRSAAYEIIHTNGGTFAPEGECLAGVVNRRPVLFAVDVNVLKLYGRAIRKYVKARLPACAFATVRPGDASKSWSQVAYLCEQADRMGLPRHGIIAGVGGGVTLDIAGVAASLFHRGVSYLRVPTTLLGIVDVAVGIKQAINFKGKKSLLGAFYPPMAAINDFAFLKTLPRAELANGFSEIVKLGLVRDSSLFEWVEQYAEALMCSGYQDPAEWARRIALRAEYVMMADLQPNLYEADLRRFPDFGHTFSGVIEEASEYSVPHGAAVAVDMLLATIIAVRRGICDEDLLRRLTLLYRVLGLSALPDACNGEVLARALKNARLHRGGHIHLVVPRKLGEGCFLEDVTAEEACRALEQAVAMSAARSEGCYAGAGY